MLEMGSVSRRLQYQFHEVLVGVLAKGIRMCCFRQFPLQCRGEMQDDVFCSSVIASAGQEGRADAQIHSFAVTNVVKID